MESIKKQRSPICKACAFDNEVQVKTGRYDGDYQPTSADRDSFIALTNRLN